MWNSRWNSLPRWNFGRLVLGCINTDFCNQIITHFSGFFENYTIYKPSHRSNLKICWFSPKFRIKFLRIFENNFVKFCWYLLKSVIFRRDFHGFLPEFHRMSEILMDLMLQTSKIQNSFRKSRNFAKTFCRNSAVSFMVSPHQETEFHIRTPPHVGGGGGMYSTM